MPINIVFISIILLLGSDIRDGPRGCQSLTDERCRLQEYATFHGFYGFRLAQIVTSVSIVLFALTSEGFQWVFSAWPFIFLGKIAYTLNLFHELVIVWMAKDTFNYMVGEGYDPEMTVLYVYLIFTPLLLFVSWILEFLIDEPAS